MREAGAPCKGKVGPKGIRESRQRFSGYPDDYLAPSFFEEWRCGERSDTLHESGAFEGRAEGGAWGERTRFVRARNAWTDVGKPAVFSGVPDRLRRAWNESGREWLAAGSRLRNSCWFLDWDRARAAAFSSLDGERGNCRNGDVCCHRFECLGGLDIEACDKYNMLFRQPTMCEGGCISLPSFASFP